MIDFGHIWPASFITHIMCALESVTYLSMVAFQFFLKPDNLFLKCPFPCGN